MAEYCTCGAQLPPDARFCHKCGKDQREGIASVEGPAEVEAALTPAAPQPTAPVVLPPISFHNSVAVRVGFLAAGLITIMTVIPLPVVIAVLLHFVALLAGGFYAVYLYGRRTGESVSIRGGVKMGWITGIFCFVIMMVLTTFSIISFASEHNLREMFMKTAENSPAQELINNILQSDGGLAIFIFMSLLGTFLTSTILPVVGGAIGAKVLEKD